MRGSWSRRLVVAGALAALATAGFTASSVLAATPTAETPAAAAKTSSAGYVHAITGGQEKCLRAGEFCSAQYEADYENYGFSCVSGRLETSTSTSGSSGGSSSGSSCGVERWTVKTLQDFGSNRHPGEDFGKHVPALVVFAGARERPADVYPHETTGGALVTIADYLETLSS